jgi:hypothetical protein
MARKTHMSEADYKAFINDSLQTVQGARGPNASLMDVLKKHGLEPELHGAVAEKLMPMLNAPAGKLADIPHNCSWCPTCGLCSACGELNAASVGAFSASALHVID